MLRHVGLPVDELLPPATPNTPAAAATPRTPLRPGGSRPDSSGPGGSGPGGSGPGGSSSSPAPCGTGDAWAVAEPSSPPPPPPPRTPPPPPPFHAAAPGRPSYLPGAARPLRCAAAHASLEVREEHGGGTTERLARELSCAHVSPRGRREPRRGLLAALLLARRCPAARGPAEPRLRRHASRPVLPPMSATCPRHVRDMSATCPRHVPQAPARLPPSPTPPSGAAPHGTAREPRDASTPCCTRVLRHAHAHVPDMSLRRRRGVSGGRGASFDASRDASLAAAGAGARDGAGLGGGVGRACVPARRRGRRLVAAAHCRGRRRL